MHRNAKIALVAVAGLAAGGCDSFLTGPGLTENPNSPIQSTAAQLFIGVQSSQFVLQQGQLARLTSMYTQQLSGTNNQQLNWGSQYLLGESDISGFFNSVYTGGGLVDLRKIQQISNQAGDAQFEGIAKIWEAFVMGSAASLWGDLPYRQAVSDSIRYPALDPQQQVYADVQARLNEGIALLGGSGPGPVNYDLVYGGNTARWRRLAYSLKARYWLHMAERLGPAAYDSARANALLGINEVPATGSSAIHLQGPGDFRAVHGNTVSDGNIWSQFLTARQDMAAGERLIQILLARGDDPRLAGYFDPAPAVAASGTCAGYPAGYRGANQFGNASPQACATPSLVDADTRRVLSFRQPFVSWAETQLILAEAAFQRGDEPAARGALNAVRQNMGLAALPGPITLADIMEEKYIVMFQNIEAYSDWRRTCIPSLQPGGPAANNPAQFIPRRVPYGSLERLNNPNIPTPGAAPVSNWNDPNPCPTGQA